MTNAKMMMIGSGMPISQRSAPLPKPMSSSIVAIKLQHRKGERVHFFQEIFGYEFGRMGDGVSSSSLARIRMGATITDPQDFPATTEATFFLAS
jgi:hypothetical protein